MIAAPFEILGLEPTYDSDAIRRRYLELVKQFTPERHPEKFAAIRQAYESLKDTQTQLRGILFHKPNATSLEDLIGKISARQGRPRVSLAQLLEVMKKA